MPQSFPTRRSSDHLMTDFNPQQARKIVTDLGRTQLLIDGALKKFSMLTTDVIEAFPEAKLSDAASQPTLEELRSEEHTSELQSLMCISYADLSLKKTTITEPK